MSQYVIEIDDKAVTEQINRILDTILNQQLRSNYSDTGDVIAATTKEIVYSRKDEIIEKVVDRAAREIVKKGLPRLIDKLGGAGR